MVWFSALVVASLLWCCCGVQESSPRKMGGHMISTRMVHSPRKCATDSDCGDAELLTCDLETKFCKCREKYSVLSSTGKCLPAAQLGEACEESVQCQVLERNATCDAEGKFCACDSGFYKLHEDNGTLCSPDKDVGGAGEAAKAHVDVNMIIILAVLSIMFLGICVALHLFSKARFGNRRTIFNSPHPRLMHIKLNKRKKSSIRTQHLPPPPPHMVPRHHSFSGHHSPFPVSKVQKTRSHECLRSALSRPTSPRFEPRPRTAPLAEKESLPSSEDLEKKTPETLRNGLPSFLSEEESRPKAPGSPTVIITDADGAHTVVTSNPTPTPGSNV